MRIIAHLFAKLFLFFIFATGSAYSAALDCTIAGTIASGTLTVNNGSITEPLNVTNLPVGGVIDFVATATTGGNRTVDFNLITGSGTGPTPNSFALNGNAASGTSTFTNSNVAGTAQINIVLASSQNGNRRIDWTATCGVAPATVTIANTTNGTEPATDGALTVTLSAPSPTPTIISYTVAGSATPGVTQDYTTLPGTITIPANTLSATIDVFVNDDLLIEGPETVIVTLSAVTSGAAVLGAAANITATNTIGDNDSATVTIANTTNGTEPATDGALTVTLSAPSPTPTIISYTVAGSATPGVTQDYTTLPGTITIPANTLSATIDVFVNDDLLIEGPETVIVTLSAVTSGAAVLGAAANITATNTIGDNDGIAVVVQQAFNAQVHNFVSRRMNLLSTSSPTIFRNRSGTSCNAGTLNNYFFSEGDDQGLDGQFALSTNETDCTEKRNIHAWIEGQFSYFNDTTTSDGSIHSSGNFFVGFAGIGIPVSSNANIGIMGQFDWMEDQLESGDGTSEGTGWTVGPYLSVKFAEGLKLDARAAWGKSVNSARQNIMGGDFEANFETQRWLAEGILSGSTKLGDLTITPSARLFYMRESWRDYMATDGTQPVLISGGKTSIGTLSSRLQFSYLHNGPQYRIEPFASSEILWNFVNPGIYDSLGELHDENDFHMSIAGGVDISRDNSNLRIEGAFDGIGSQNLESISGKILILHKF